jgi:hypothetical protein
MLQQYPPGNLLTNNEVSDILMLLQNNSWVWYIPVICPLELGKFNYFFNPNKPVDFLFCDNHTRLPPSTDELQFTQFRGK